MVQGRPGPPPLAAKRAQFGRLIARGAGSAEACRIVGVHPKTGKRWRLGRVMISSSGARLQYAPVVDTREHVISGRFLSEDERVRIADLLGAGFGVGTIAARLGRSPSTISRELRRNRDPGSGQYRPFAAQRLAAGRRARPGRGKLLRDQELREDPRLLWIEIVGDNKAQRIVVDFDVPVHETRANSRGPDDQHTVFCRLSKSINGFLRRVAVSHTSKHDALGSALDGVLDRRAVHIGVSVDDVDAG